MSLTQQNTRLGIALMALTMLIFAVQDGISRHLASEYNVMMVVMIRYWFFAAFVLAIARRRAGGLRGMARTSQPGLQVGRGLLLAAEICVMVAAFTLLGLVESHAIFASYPLIVAALSGPLLGERVGRLRWTAIGLGFVGVLVILRPGFGVFAPAALVAVCSALMFSLYALLTRKAAAKDDAMTSFLYTGLVGAVAMTAAGVWFWEPMTAPDWAWMIALCITGVSGHWTLIRAYEVAEASAVQPFCYLHLVFAATVGVAVFAEPIEPNVILGAAIVVGAGLFTLWREARANRA